VDTAEQNDIAHRTRALGYEWRAGAVKRQQ
jgi:hypothetical protein